MPSLPCQKKWNCLQNWDKISFVGTFGGALRRLLDYEQLIPYLESFSTTKTYFRVLNIRCLSKCQDCDYLPFQSSFTLQRLSMRPKKWLNLFKCILGLTSKLCVLCTSDLVITIALFLLFVVLHRQQVAATGWSLFWSHGKLLQEKRRLK